MKKPRFSLKALLFVVTLAAVLLGWWVDHRDGAIEKRELERKLQKANERERSFYGWALIEKKLPGWDWTVIGSNDSGRMVANDDSVSGACEQIATHLTGNPINPYGQ